jgi:hypothetical protein
VAVRQSGEVNPILGLRNVNWGWNVVGKSSMLVEVEDEQAVIGDQYFPHAKDPREIWLHDLRVFPVLRVSESIINVLDQLLASRHIASWVHGIDRAAFRVDV